MGEDIFVRLKRLPQGIRAVTAPGIDSYSVYIDDRLSDDQRLLAFQHELQHIKNGDFDIDADVNKIENNAHKRG